MKLKTILTTLLLLIVAGGAQALETNGNWSDASYRDTQWGGDITSTAFVIENYAQLAQFAYLVNNGNSFSGKYVMLSPQGEFPYYIMDDHYWTPIGTADHPFRGTFDGNGISVNYLKINSSGATYQGLFGYIGAGGIVKNTTVRYSTITVASQVGAIAGYNGGTMTNCVVINSTITGSSYAGTIVGQNAGSMTTCYAITSGSTKAIGVEGSATGADTEGGQCLWTITGTNIQASVGTPTGTTLNNIEFYNDGIHFNNTHYYKSGTQTTVNYAQDGYTAIFSISSGDGASISGDVVTVGTSDVVVSAEATMAEWSGTGESGSPYLISNSDQFALLANRVNGGTNYSGKYFKLTDNISTSTMVGTSANKFSGTFDGDGHTLTVTLNSDADYCAPFAYTDGATIQNLVIDGTITTSARYAGGVVGNSSANLTMTNVKSSVAINSSFSGQAYHGGLVGYAVNATLTGCAFTGSLLGGNSTKCGGLMGYKTNEAIFTDCVFAPAEVTVSTTGSYTLVVSDGIAEINNCYYTTALGTTQGKQVYSIVPAQNVTVQLLNLETKYNVSGIATNSSSSKGLKFGDAFYAASGDLLDFVLGVEEGYTASDYYVNGTKLNDPVDYMGHYSMTMPAQDIAITADLVATEQIDANSWLHANYRAASFSAMGTNSITIMSAAELALLAYNVNYGGKTYNGYTITIVADHIDLAGHTWEPIGYGLNGTSGFHGTFDGAGKVISNMEVRGDSYVGLFSTVPSGATVKDVFITYAAVYGCMAVGTVAGQCQGTIQNCHVSNSAIELVASNAGGELRPVALGGIAGMCDYGIIKGCTILESSIYPQPEGSSMVGGIAGEATRGFLKDNLSAADIAKKANDSNFGAIVGIAQEGSLSNNYYVDGLGIYDTPNTTLYGINGLDYPGDAVRAYFYPAKPADFGAVATDYGYCMEAYSAGLHFNMNWYSPNKPRTMNITLSNDGNNSSLLSDYKDVTGTVKLGGRTFYKDGTWNTICLPFGISDVNDSPLCAEGETVELYQLVASGDDSDTGFDEESVTLTLNFESLYDEDSNETPLAAGQPYLIRWKNATGTLVDPVFENVTIEKTAPETKGNTFGNNDEITFIGTFNGMSFNATDRSILFLGGNNKLYYPEANASIGACRAYFLLNGISAGEPEESNPIKSFVLNFDDETGIFDVRGKMEDGRGDGVIYNIAGQRLNKPQRGINIVNGRKVVIK